MRPRRAPAASAGPLSASSGALRRICTPGPSSAAGTISSGACLWWQIPPRRSCTKRHGCEWHAMVSVRTAGYKADCLVHLSAGLHVPTGVLGQKSAEHIVHSVTACEAACARREWRWHARGAHVRPIESFVHSLYAFHSADQVPWQQTFYGRPPACPVLRTESFSMIAYLVAGSARRVLILEYPPKHDILKIVHQCPSSTISLLALHFLQELQKAFAAAAAQWHISNANISQLCCTHDAWPFQPDLKSAIGP